MSLPHGCNSIADKHFATRYKQTQVYESTNNTKTVTMKIPESNFPFCISSIYGDCTAAQAYLEFLQIEHVATMFTALQEYMSINARISCLFTLKKDIKELDAWIKELKKFPIAGLHIQKSNREPDSTKYMISGILKVLNPIVNTYTVYTEAYPEKHDNNYAENVNQLNAKFGLQTF